MKLYQVPTVRAMRPRARTGCGERLSPNTPAHHRNCRQCWSLDKYWRAMFAFLAAARPR